MGWRRKDNMTTSTAGIRALSVKEQLNEDEAHLIGENVEINFPLKAP